MYSSIYMKHFGKPKNIGKIDDGKHFSVKHEGGGCMDTTDFWVVVEDDIIKDVKYQTRGCSGTIATMSYVSELIKGMKVSDIKQITSERLVEELGLPEKKEHCAKLAVKLLKKI